MISLALFLADPDNLFWWLLTSFPSVRERERYIRIYVLHYEQTIMVLDECLALL